MTRQNKITNTSLALAALLLGTLGSACDAGSNNDDGETGEAEAESGEAEAGDGDGDGDAGLLKLGGSYTDEWDSTHVIDDLSWQHDSARYGITQFNNAAQYVIAQNDAANEFSPDLWSRFDFTYVENTLYYCQSAFDAASEADALAASPADATDPATAGCGGMFAWTKLADTALELEGSYTDQFDGPHTVDTSNWISGDSTFTFTQFDSQADFAIAENGAENAFSPGLFSRFDWVYVENNLYYCQSAFDAADAAAALATPRPDDSDPAVSGCGGMFAWTRLQ